MLIDIQNIEDIALLVNHFYDRARADEEIGHYFNEIIAINWEEHIPTIVSFWDNILFSTGHYKGGVMYKHQQLNQLSSFSPRHFESWLLLWEESVNELFKGKNANEVVFRAKTIAAIMQTKLQIK